MIHKKSYLMILILMILSLLVITIIPSYSMAATSYDPIEHPENYKPGTASDADVTKLTNKAKPIVDTISVIGIIISVITLSIIGVKYMIGSVQEKAEYKKTMLSYVIGVIFIVGIITILQIINNIVIPLVNQASTIN